MEIDLHETQLGNGDWLYLATTRDDETPVAANQYTRRYDVEHDIRDLKVSLGIEEIRAKSDEMVQKELLCSVVAYNLVMQLRREAAKIAGVKPRRLSFTGVWTTMQSYLLHTLLARQPTGPCATNAPCALPRKPPFPVATAAPIPAAPNPPNSRSNRPTTTRIPNPQIN